MVSRAEVSVIARITRRVVSGMALLDWRDGEDSLVTAEYRTHWMRNSWEWDRPGSD